MSDNIQVVVRCRARSRQEIAAKSPPIVQLQDDVFSAQEPYVTVASDSPAPIISAHMRPFSSASAPGKVFRVDQVYGPGANQSLVFNNVALPLFHDFVAGLNVTILAYGQTGSGKTYSMCGDLHGDNSGIIPRVLARLFASPQPDRVVKLSCVELYKEELHDLINDELDLVSVKSKLRLVADPSKERQSTTIQNLTEVNIDSCEMGFKILQKCLNRRRTSATKLNDLSSRSHTIFSIILYQRSPADGADASSYRVSKMNLVDLAGSEDINKSGAINERAREAGAINQSLLTLGKVINSLSEGKEPRHIPYRDSKLTRLLQGSIGGKTKTALIATISPAKINANETLSTLNYASKAKNIRNLPQSTHDSDVVLKKILVSELSDQVARLTRDLMASKDKDGGIKMSVQNYQDYNNNIVELQTTLKEKSAEIAGLASKLDSKQAEIEALNAKVLEMERDFLRYKESEKLQKAEILTLQSSLQNMQSRHSDQKQKISEVMQNNLSVVNNMIKNTIVSVTSTNSDVSHTLQDAKGHLIKQLSEAHLALKDLSSSLANTLGPEMKKEIEQVMQHQFTLPDGLVSLKSFSVDEQLESFGGLQQKLYQQLDCQFDANAHTETLTTTKQKLITESEALKNRVLSNIRSELEALFSSNTTELSKAFASSTTSVLAKSKAGVHGVLQSSHREQNELIAEVKHKAGQIASTVTEFEDHYTKSKQRASVVMQEKTEDQVKGAIAHIGKFTTREKQGTESVVTKAFDTIGSKLDLSKNSIIEQLEGANNDLENLDVKIKELASPHSKTSPGTKLSRSPTAFKSPDAKRRRPMSPLKSHNGLYKTRIPQLNPLTK